MWQQIGKTLESKWKQKKIKKTFYISIWNTPSQNIPLTEKKCFSLDVCRYPNHLSRECQTKCIIVTLPILIGKVKKRHFFPFLIFFHFCPKDKENSLFFCKKFEEKMQFFSLLEILFFQFPPLNSKHNKNLSQFFDFFSSYFNFLFEKKNCIFSPNFLQKKKLFSLSFGQKWKKIRKWKKVPFFHFPYKAWGGVTMRHLVWS